MISELVPAATELVREFYANLHTPGDDNFMTWLCGKYVRVDAELISTITHTP
jgi:hypothetical protein